MLWLFSAAADVIGLNHSAPDNLVFLRNAITVEPLIVNTSKMGIPPKVINIHMYLSPRPQDCPDSQVVEDVVTDCSLSLSTSRFLIPA